VRTSAGTHKTSNEFPVDKSHFRKRLRKCEIRHTCDGSSVADLHRHLTEISKAPRETWHLLVKALVDKGWSVKDTAKQVDTVKKFAVPPRWSDWFPLGGDRRPAPGGGRSYRSLRNSAAEVYAALRDTCNEVPVDQHRHLYEISKAPHETCHAQGELSPLEVGMHALRYTESKGQGQSEGLTEYAGRIGRSKGAISKLRAAAEVLDATVSPGNSWEDFGDKTKHLYVISGAKRETWHAQGELSPLEVGMHVLLAVPLAQGRSGGGLSAYAARVTYGEDSLRQWRQAASVYRELPDTCREAVGFDRTRHLFEISKAPEETWLALVKALVDKGWSVKDTVKQGLRQLVAVFRQVAPAVRPWTTC
jgi:hypothetical protein